MTKPFRLLVAILLFAIGILYAVNTIASVAAKKAHPAPDGLVDQLRTRAELLKQLAHQEGK